MNRNRIWQQETAQEGMLESFGIAVWMVFKENIQITKCLYFVLKYRVGKQF
jgi:hypothetical protein